MTRMRLLPALSLLGVSLFCRAQSAPATQGTAAPSPSTAAQTKSYTDQKLHLRYDYPGSYNDASAMVGPAFEASVSHAAQGSKDEMRCVSLPFSAMDNTGGGLSLVLLVRVDAGCLKKTFTPELLPDFTRGEVQGLAASGAHTQFGEPVPFTTAGGHAADLIRGTFELPTGQSLHAMVACVLVKPDVACWQFLGSSEDKVRAMSVFPVSLDGGAAAPLVPAQVLAAKP